MDHNQVSVHSMSALLNQSTDTEDDTSCSPVSQKKQILAAPDSEVQSVPGDLVQDKVEAAEQVELTNRCENGVIKNAEVDLSSARSSVSEVKGSLESGQVSEKEDIHVKIKNTVKFAGELEEISLGFDQDSVISDSNAPKSIKSVSSVESLKKDDKKLQEVKTRTFMALLFIFIVCGVTMIYHLYHLKLQELMKDKQLVYNIDVSDLILYNRQRYVVLKGTLGVKLRLEKFPHYCDNTQSSTADGDIYDELCLMWKDLADVDVVFNKSDSLTCYEVSWLAHNPDVQLQDCFEIGDAQWYGMGLFPDQQWPINSHSVGKIPFLAGMPYDEQTLGPVLHPYWLSSQGVAIIVDPTVPLHVSFNSLITQHADNSSEDVTDKKLCLYADYKKMPLSRESLPQLKYKICIGSNIAEVHSASINLFSSAPSVLPDLSVVSHPVWSALPHLKRNVSQQAVRELCQLVSEQYAHGLFVLDGSWQDTVGELVFSKTSFSDPHTMIQNLKMDGFRVVVSAHPYLSYDSRAFRDAVDQDLLVRSGLVPGLTWWWSGEPHKYTPYHVVGVIDMFPEAEDWFGARLSNFSKTFDIDGYYWKGGLADVQPYFPNFRANFSSPNEYLLKMAEFAESLGGINIQQSAFLSQHIPMWLRLYGHKSQWTGDKSLQSIIPSVLTLGLLGYPFVLPDVIGGSAYDHYPSKELYMRWLELTAFLPAMHFSIPPDHYDTETIKLAREMIDLHVSYVAPYVFRLSNESLENRLPIIRPLWMSAPDEPDAYTIGDQFLVGDDILVAPVIAEGQRVRDVFIPPGIWQSKLHHYFVQGPKWIRSLPIPVNKIAYFERKLLFS